MKTLSEIRFLILASPDAASANKIISDNYNFITLAEKLAFLKGMFGTELIGKVKNNLNEETYFDILNNILSKNRLDTSSVRKNVTIPAWLNDISVKNNINFSRVLQEALKERFGFNN